MTITPAGAPVAQDPSPVPDAKMTAFPVRFVGFWWIRIPIQLRRISSTLATMWSDDVYLTAWPRAAMILVLAVFVFGFIEGGTHWSYRTIVGTNGFAGNVLADSATADNWGGPTRIIFAENLLLLMAGVGVGSLSANLGITLVLGYVLGDIFLAGVKLPLNVRFNDAVPIWVYRHVPLLVSYILFLLLVAMPISMAKHFAANAPSNSRISRVRNFAITALTVSAMIYCWGCMAAMVFRIVWLWPGGVPRIPVAFYRDMVTTYVIPVALVGLAIRSILVSRAGANRDFLPRLQHWLLQSQPERRCLSSWMHAIVAAAIITLLMSGFMYDPGNYSPNLFANFSENEIVFAALCVGLLVWVSVLPRLGFWQRWSEAANRYSAAIRLAAATVISYLVCRLVLLFPGTISYRPGEFGPEVAAILVGIAATLALLPTGWQRIPASERWFPRIGISTASTGTRAAVVACFVFLLTEKLFGDCGERQCCFSGLSSLGGAAAAGTIPGLGGIAAGIAGGVAAGIGSAAPGSNPNNPQPPGQRGTGPDTASGTGGQGGTSAGGGLSGNPYVRLAGGIALTAPVSIPIIIVGGIGHLLGVDGPPPPHATGNVGSSN